MCNTYKVQTNVTFYKCVQQDCINVISNDCNLLILIKIWFSNLM